MYYCICLAGVWLPPLYADCDWEAIHHGRRRAVEWHCPESLLIYRQSSGHRIWPLAEAGQQGDADNAQQQPRRPARKAARAGV